MQTITLADGAHTLNPPTAQTLIVLSGLGYDPWGEDGAAAFSLNLLAPDKGTPKKPDRHLNLEAVRDHLLALLLESEPDAEWTGAKVASLMPPMKLAEYVTALLEVGTEGWSEPDPKADSGDGSPSAPE